MDEIWKPIPGYEGKYEVSNYGRIKSYVYNHGHANNNEGKIHKPLKIKKYLGFITCINSVCKHVYVHRAVWEAFNGHIPKGMQINHKDENPHNNRLDNLEIVTPKENSNYGSHNEKLSKVNRNHPSQSMPVLQFDLQGNFIKEWPSIREAGRYYGNAQNICANLKGKINYAYNSIWKYAN